MLRQGLKWNGAGQIVSQVCSIIGSVILARLLLPNDFGTVALVAVVIGFLSLFLDAGFTTALVQTKAISKRQLSSVFWLNLLICTVLYLLMVSSGRLLADFYQNEEVLKIIYVAPLVLFPNTLNQIPRVLLQRKLRFRQLAIPTLYSIPFSFGLAIFLAYKGFGIWSILTQQLVQASLTFLICWSYTSFWKPVIGFWPSSIKSIFSFSAYTFGNSILTYAAQNLDNVLIGKYFNTAELGIYTKSFAFILLPVRNFSSVAAQTLFPIISRSQTDLKATKKAYLKTFSLVIFIVTPLMIGIAITSTELVPVVFGENWNGMVPILQVFSILGVIASINALNDSTIAAMGRADLLFKYGIIEKVISILAIVIGLGFGVMGIVWAKLASACITFIIKKTLFIKVSRLAPNTILRNVIKPIFAVAIMSGCVYKISCVVQGSLIFSLSIQVFSGAIIYILCLFLLKDEILRLILHEFKKK